MDVRAVGSVETVLRSLECGHVFVGAASPDRVLVLYLGIHPLRGGKEEVVYHGAQVEAALTLRKIEDVDEEGWGQGVEL